MTAMASRPVSGNHQTSPRYDRDEHQPSLTPWSHTAVLKVQRQIWALFALRDSRGTTIPFSSDLGHFRDGGKPPKMRFLAGAYAGRGRLPDLVLCRSLLRRDCLWRSDQMSVGRVTGCSPRRVECSLDSLRSASESKLSPATQRATVGLGRCCNDRLVCLTNEQGARDRILGLLVLDGSSAGGVSRLVSMWPCRSPAVYGTGRGRGDDP